MCLAVPGKVVSREDVGGQILGRVDFSGITREAWLDLVPETQPGDYVLVHVGFAISRLDEEEARRTLELIAETGAFDEEAESPDAAT
jgi:hydrogenase expression/formation protein HypC